MSSALSLVVLLLATRIAASQTFTDAGKDFIVIFPENIAYFYPSDAQNQVWVTALHDGTSVSVSPASSGPKQLDAGRTARFNVTQELGRLTASQTNVSDPFAVFNISDKTVRVTSSRDVVVQAVSSKGRSVQSVLVPPTAKLSTRFFIPPVPEGEGRGAAGDEVVNVTERSPFRLIILNPAGPTASVAVRGRADVLLRIRSGEAAQLWVRNDSAAQVVEADQKVSVFLSHPCAARSQCSCGLLHAAVPPARNATRSFPVPPVPPVLGPPDSVLLSDQTGRSRTDPPSGLVESSGSVLAHWPGLLLTLVPVEEFGSCFVVQFIQGQENVLVIVVHKDQKQGVRMGSGPLEEAGWQELQGTDYVSTNRSFSSTSVVWHSAANMTVYHLVQQNHSWFGSPAPAVSANPDFRGCVLTPEVSLILHEAETWQESIRSCQNQNLSLISVSSEALQNQTCHRLRGSDAQQVWIGSRRSSLTGGWYWLDRSGFNHTNWAGGEPGDVSQGQCAVMSLEGDCGWKDRSCCDGARPLCYAAPQVLHIG